MFGVVVIIIVIYILSVWFVRECLLMAHRDMIHKLDGFDVFLCLLPICNLALIIACVLIEASEKQKTKKRTITDWFFKR